MKSRPKCRRRRHSTSFLRPPPPPSSPYSEPAVSLLKSALLAAAIPAALAIVVSVHFLLRVLLAARRRRLRVKVGDALPDVTLYEGQPAHAKSVAVSLREMCAGKTVVLFAVSGAFCDGLHLPSFVDAFAMIQRRGVDTIVCTATNDAAVMYAWGLAAGARIAGIRMLSHARASCAELSASPPRPTRWCARSATR